MVYHGTVVSEKIAFYPAGEPSKMHYIELAKSSNDPIFWVSCCYEDWFYEFALESNSDYERVKFNIMEAIFECEDMDELLTCLSEVFEDGFANILTNTGGEHDSNQETQKYLN